MKQEQNNSNTLDPTMEVKTALTELVDDFASVKAQMKSQILQQEKRLKTIEQNAHRPNLATKTDADAPESKAFQAYIRSGDENALRAAALETKVGNLYSSNDSSGGFLINPDTASSIDAMMNKGASLRSVSNVVQVESNSYELLVDNDGFTSDWVSESASRSQTGVPAFERIAIGLHELSAMPRISQRLLDDSAFDVDDWLTTRIANQFIRAEGAAFIKGSGVSKPKGILNYTKEENSANLGSKIIGYIATGSVSDFSALSTAEKLIDLVYALAAQYRSNASFVMNSKTAGALRKIKDNDGRFLWADGLVEAGPARLLGYPVLIAEDMPDVGANQYPVAFGDFNAGYTVVERPDVRIQRDPFTEKPYVLFYTTKRVGGGVSDFNAIKLLKVAVS